MSVPVHLRTENKLEFLKIASEIEAECFHCYKKIKRHYKETYGQRILNLSGKIVDEINIGSSIYAQFKEEYLQKISHYNEAKGACSALKHLFNLLIEKQIFELTQLKDKDGVIKSTYKPIIPEKALIRINNLIKKEEKLLTGLIKQQRTLVYKEDNTK